MMKRTLVDAHCHLCGGEEEKVRREQNIVSLTCAVSPAEAAILKNKAGGIFIPCYGLHPWQADRFDLEDMIPFMREGAAIGEIGMDSEWCQAPLKKQEEVFVRQLQLAARWKKPVILHTKGQEQRIGEIIRDFPLTYLVHWYSSMDYLKLYQEMDCYFTAGPDLAVNPAVYQVVRECPADRILVETDGWSAVEWALGEMPVGQIGCLLEKNMEIIGIEKNLQASLINRQIEDNFYRFLGISEKNKQN